jgi:hypothetical protein
MTRASITKQGTRTTTDQWHTDKADLVEVNEENDVIAEAGEPGEKGSQRIGQSHSRNASSSRGSKHASQITSVQQQQTERGQVWWCVM